jgi:hypothetical protein
MATATFHHSLPQAGTEPRKGLLIRFFDALMEARMRQAMRELALHRHLLPREEARLPDPVPHDEVKRAGYTATYADAGLLPFVR